MASNYRIGTGISEVIDPAIGLQLQGFAVESQKTKGIESPLFSRAFIVEDLDLGIPTTGRLPGVEYVTRRVVLVTADIWSATNAVKQEVVKRLKLEFGTLYTDDNVLISGTHTHSAPGGYAGYRLYDLSGEGFDTHTFECIVSGIFYSIRDAHNNLAPGKIYINKGDIEDCGRNRSLDAYRNNPQSERDLYPNRDTDKEMLLLKFTQLDSNGKERPIGVLSWFAIHPTDLGQKNAGVSGDSKGYASALFEWRMAMDPWVPFVAAFANGSAGDVSGNVEFNHIPNGIDDIQHMRKHGKQQYNKAKELFDSASEELSGWVTSIHTRVDMSCVQIKNSQGARTWPAALGLSFGAGSTEDGVPEPPTLLREGITGENKQATEDFMQTVAGVLGLMVKQIPPRAVWAESHKEILNGHLPKPVLFAVGATEGLAPKILPLQILRIGQLVILGVPAELTTMAGRRLRKSVLSLLEPGRSFTGIQHLAIAGYANDYSQYVTTKEEYDMQHYEGASTLFGPYTLEAYQQEFGKLALALRTGNRVEPGPLPSGNSSPVARRWTFRNVTNKDVQIELYHTVDSVKWLKLPNGTKTLPAYREIAFPEREFTGPAMRTVEQVKAIFNRAQEKIVAVGSLVTITQEGYFEITEYVPIGTRGGPPPLPRGLAAKGDRMQPGEVLNPGQSIVSANGRFRFTYQDDGNLVLYRDGATPRWASATNGRGVGVCIMQSDGKLMLYTPGGGTPWMSTAGGTPGSYLVAQNDGNVVIRRPDNQPVWASNTAQ